MTASEPWWPEALSLLLTLIALTSSGLAAWSRRSRSHAESAVAIYDGLPASDEKDHWASIAVAKARLHRERLERTGHKRPLATTIIALLISAGLVTWNSATVLLADTPYNWGVLALSAFALVLWTLLFGLEAAAAWEQRREQKH